MTDNHDEAGADASVSSHVCDVCGFDHYGEECDGGQSYDPFEDDGSWTNGL